MLRIFFLLFRLFFCIRIFLTDQLERLGSETQTAITDIAPKHFAPSSVIGTRIGSQWTGLAKVKPTSQKALTLFPEREKFFCFKEFFWHLTGKIFKRNEAS